MQFHGRLGPRIAVAVLFSLSCFTILLLLWQSFGGPVPLKPRGYRFTATFPEATLLGTQAEVRISGVPVGKVIALERSPGGGRTRATIELQRRYAPLPADSRAMLRAKTLIGETYVDLMPGRRGAPVLRDGGHLADAQIAPTVELDEIYRALDAPTRRAFQTWMEQQALAIDGRGRDVNDALGQFRAFAEDAGLLMRILRGQEPQLRGLVRDTGTVFAALSERRGALRGSIDNWQRVMDTFARRNEDFAATFRALPTFEREGSAAMQRLGRFSRNADPLVTRLRGVAPEFASAMRAVDATAPWFRRLMSSLDPVTRASRRGLPAASRFLREARPALAEMSPPLVQFAPLLAHIGTNRRELMAFVVNIMAATQGSSAPGNRDEPIHYLRAEPILTPASLAPYPRIMGWERRNPYMPSGAMPGRMQVYDARTCGDEPWPALASNPAVISPELEALIRGLVLGDRRPIAPPCVQAPLAPGQSTRFPHVEPLRPTKGP
jgi:ABC-type transporter Mla subunit MlaD